MTRDPSAQRDANLRLVRRLRVGLVSAGVAGSLGVAGAVAAQAPSTTSGVPAPRPAAPAQVGGGGSGGDDFSGWQDDGGGDDGGQAQDQPRNQPRNQQQDQPRHRRQDRPRAPGLQPGSGHSHGSTSGS